MICIQNLHHNKARFEYDIIIDRTSILGNQFYMKDESHRDEVCDKYEKWFQEKLYENDPEFKAELNRLLLLYVKHGKLVLFCWCFPRRCHAKTIKKYIENMSWGLDTLPNPH